MDGRAAFRGQRIGPGRSIAALAACALLWSSAGILIKLVDWHPMAIAGCRSLIGFLVMLAFLGRRPDFRPRKAMFAGAILYSATMILFVTANKLTTSANANLLQYSAPLWTALGGALLSGERPCRRDGLFSILTIGAVVLFFLDELSGAHLLGNILALASGLTFGLAFVFIRASRRGGTEGGGGTEEPLMLSHLLTFAVSIPFIFMAGNPGGRFAWLGIACLGLFQVGLASVLLARGIRGVSALGSVLTTTLEPVMNPVWVFLLKRESPSPWAIAGGCLIVLLVALRPMLPEGLWRRMKNEE